MGIHNILCDGFNDRLTFEVDALNLIACVLRSRIESHGQVQTRMKTFAEERKAPPSVFCFSASISCLFFVRIKKLHYFEALFFNSSTSFCKALSCL